MSEKEPVGELADVEQADPGDPIRMPAVPVDVEGIVPVQHVPSTSVVSTIRYVNSMEPVRVAKTDGRRRSLKVIIADLTSTRIWVAFGTTAPAALTQRACAAWPRINGTLDVSCADEVWVLAEPGEVATVATIDEFWAG